MEKLKKVIDGDRQVILDQFPPSQTDEYLKKYKEKGLWEDVSLDRDGDIILFKED